MASGRAEVSRQLQTLFTLGTAGALSDGELLERFASRRGAVAEAAFAALVERHGPVVLRVCRDVLGNSADAEDAFQATFLVLVRRASSIRNRDSLASWLYGVALRVAGCDRSATTRRRVHERKAAERPTDHVEGGEDDLGPVLHEEVDRLPEKYRAAVVLCYWEGLTHEQAADRLRWPVGTVRSRLAWARQRLRSRLIRRGLAPAVALVVVELSNAALAVPEALMERTVQGGLQLVSGTVQTGVISTAALVLAEGVIKAMMLARWKMTAVVLSTVGIAGAGAGGLALQAGDGPQKSEAPKGEIPKLPSPRPELAIHEQIRKLKAYKNELNTKLEAQEKVWLELAEKSIVELIEQIPPSDAMPNRTSLEEYRQVREQLFINNMKLIETESLPKIRQAENEERDAEVAPELLVQKRIKDALRKDPEIASLMKEIDQIQRRVDMANYRTRNPSDPSLVHPARQLEALKQDLRDLVARKQEELTMQLRDEDKGATSLRDLEGQITSLKARKGSYEKLLSRLQVANQKEMSLARRMALAREDLASLREMRTTVEKRIEQLEYDARAAQPR